MFWRILPHATACSASGKLLLLDLRQDRYFAVPEALAGAMLEWLERRYACAPPPEIRALLGRARITRDGDPDPNNALKERVTFPTALERPSGADARIIGRLALSALIAGTWTKLRTRSLHGILENRAARPVLPVRGHHDEISVIAASYDERRSSTPISRNCLLDSLALDALLARHGFGAKLVFGVCATPFGAHCWLQTSDMVLNDSYDHVARFTPIFAQ